MTDRLQPNLRDGAHDAVHERYDELCALAMSGALSAEESSELENHLRCCGECREAYREYKALTEDGMPHLASRYSPEEADGWDEAARQKLLASVAADQSPAQPKILRRDAPSLFHVPNRIASHPLLTA